MALARRESLSFFIPLIVLISNSITSFGQLTFVAVDFNEIPEGFTIIDRDTTYEGDLVIDGNKSVLIENCSFAIKGRIVVSDSSTLVIRDAKVRLIESRESEVGEGEFWFNISGDSRFQAIDIAIETIYFRSFSIHVSGSADVLFSNVYSLEWYGLVCEGDSRIQIVDSVCWSMIETKDTSILSVRDSRIYGVNVTGDSKTTLEGVYTTRASVAESGSLEIRDSTISSQTDGLEIIFCRGTNITLRNFSTVPSGIEYEYCEHWSLQEDNEVAKAYMNATLNKVYLRQLRFIMNGGSDVAIDGLQNPNIGVVCSNEDLTVNESTLNSVATSRVCVLRAYNVYLKKLHASQRSSAYVFDSKLDRVSCENESVTMLSSSEIESVECNGGAFLHLNNCSLPESISVVGNSIIFHDPQQVTIDEVNYNVAKGLLSLGLKVQSMGGASINMVLNRGRIRYRSKLEITSDDEAQEFDIDTKKDLGTISFLLPPGETRLEVSLGPPPPEYVPFFLTPVGQQIISFLIILILVIAVLVAWR